MLLFYSYLHGVITHFESQSSPPHGQTRLNLSYQGSKEHLKFNTFEDLQKWIHHRPAAEILDQRFLLTVEETLNDEKLAILNSLLKPFESVKIKVWLNKEEGVNLIKQMIADQKIRSLNIENDLERDLKDKLAKKRYSFLSFLKEQEDKGNESLKTLAFKMNNLSYDDDLIELDNLLKQFKHTKFIMGIQENGLGPKGLALINEMIADQKIGSLIFVGTKLREEDAEALAQAIEHSKNLTSLSFANHGVSVEVAKILARTLKHNTVITSLDFAGSGIRKEGVHAIAEALNTNTTLTSLDLSSHGVEDEEAQALAEALRKNKTLTSLRLVHTQIGDVGAQALAEALKENETLTSLTLWNNQVGAEGAQALADALKINTTLTKLSFRSDKIRAKEVVAFKEVKARVELG